MGAIPTITVHLADGSSCVINAGDFVEGRHSLEPPKPKATKKATKKSPTKKRGK